MAFSSKQVAAMQYKKAFGKNPAKIDETGTEFRFRQRNPGDFQRDSFRRIDIGKKGGFEAVIGRPKGMSTTRVQTFILPKRELNRMR